MKNIKLLQKYEIGYKIWNWTQYMKLDTKYEIGTKYKSGKKYEIDKKYELGT